MTDFLGRVGLGCLVIFLYCHIQQVQWNVDWLDSGTVCLIWSLFRAIMLYFPEQWKHRIEKIFNAGFACFTVFCIMCQLHHEALR